MKTRYRFEFTEDLCEGLFLLCPLTELAEFGDITSAVLGDKSAMTRILIRFKIAKSMGTPMGTVRHVKLTKGEIKYLAKYLVERSEAQKQKVELLKNQMEIRDKDLKAKVEKQLLKKAVMAGKSTTNVLPFTPSPIVAPIYGTTYVHNTWPVGVAQSVSLGEVVTYGSGEEDALQKQRRYSEWELSLAMSIMHKLYGDHAEQAASSYTTMVTGKRTGDKLQYEVGKAAFIGLTEKCLERESGEITL